jgi:hypothetical protein
MVDGVPSSALSTANRDRCSTSTSTSNWQCAFRKGRGLNEAVLTLRSLMHKCHRYKQPLYLAFVDLRKAYDSIPRGALWRVLSAYGVDPQAVDLLADLHTGTQAAVKLAGSKGDWFDIDRV